MGHEARGEFGYYVSKVASQERSMVDQLEITGQEDLTRA